MSDSSIDAQELNKFNKTYADWWDLNGEFKILHQINPLRIDYIIKKTVEHFNIPPATISPLRGLSFLDVGCGGGIVSSALYKLGASLTAIDANEHNIFAARHYAKDNNLSINFLHQTIEEHLIEQRFYDIIICLEVIEHVAKPAIFIHNLCAALKPGGMMILSTINRTIKSYLQAVIMAEKILGLIPCGTHDYNKFLKPSEIQNFLVNSGKKIQEMKGLGFNLSNGKWMINDNIDVNYFAYIK